MAELRYFADVVTLELVEEKCIGCGMCVEVCPHEVYVIENRKAVIVDRDACMECGACAMNCSADAIQVDAGVGCATAVIAGAIRGTEPTCGCAEDPSCCC